MNLDYEPLLYVAPGQSTDMLYFGRFWAPDAFLAFGCKGEKIACLNALERERGKKESQFDVVLALEDILPQNKMLTIWDRYAQLIQTLQKEYKINGFYVPEEFPFALGLALNKLGVSLMVQQAPFFKEQMLKTSDEIDLLIAANQIAIKAFESVKHILTKAEIGHENVLYFEEKPLTSEYLQGIIETTCLSFGAQAECIVAGGIQACDPHAIGTGPLHAHEFIIIDIFPRLKKSGYYGDMTRTFLKGHPSDEQMRLIQAVKNAQDKAITLLKPGEKACNVHQAVIDVFNHLNYKTTIQPGKTEGFIHSTGHGVGLGLHEPIRISAASETILEAGMVITIEPGLYYQEIGGVRIEDVYLITPTGAQCLSNFSYDWHII